MKNRLVVYSSLIMALISTAAPSYAGYVFRPYPRDLSDLPHENYFTWGIHFVLPADEKIIGATLEFKNIWDWSTEEDDHLFIRMLDNPKAGVQSYIDNQGGGDNFAGKGVLIDNWHDPVGGHSRNFDLIYDFREMGLLNNLLADLATKPRGNYATFGFGIDSDCHFLNDEIIFTLYTQPLMNPVPEPATLILIALGAATLKTKNLKIKT